MHKVTVSRNGQTFEVSDLTFDQVKELIGMNGHARSETNAPEQRKGASLNPDSFIPDYIGFKKALTPKAKQFVKILRDNPNGISADHLADQLGFQAPVQIGGMTGGGMGKIAPTYGVDMEDVYVREIKFLNGERRVIYRPGKAIGEIAA
jgi:hypothetical protein